jgi:hypothetical protein
VTEFDGIAALLSSQTLAEAKAAVNALEATAAYKWMPVGMNDANYGLINIGSDSGLALVERITNAVDAIIERGAQALAASERAKLRNPREAVRKIFDVPDGRLVKITLEKRADLASRVRVRLLDGADRDHPVVEIRDVGIGIDPDQFADTILSIARGNKLDKMYLAGAYGQGGSTTFAFAAGSLVAARSEHSQVGVTFVRFNELDPRKNKNGVYEYLVLLDGSVPRLPNELLDFDQGVLVRHFDFELRGYAQAITQLQKSLWSLTHTALFDPILPFTIIDGRVRQLEKNGGKPVLRTVAGNYARLYNDARDKVEYKQTITLNPLHGRDVGKVTVHYWVIKDEGDTAPAASYIDPNYPIVFTHFGQTHGYEDKRFISDTLKLPFLKGSLVIQVELDALTPTSKRELLSSTRDRLKKGHLYEALLENTADALRDDERLDEINIERRARLLTRRTSTDQEKIKRRFAELLEKFRPGIDVGVGGTGSQGTARPKRTSHSSQPLPPLPTAEYPTFIRLANKVTPIEAHLDRLSVLLVESDAPNDYLSINGATLGVIADPSGSIDVVRHNDFSDGRARIAIRPRNVVVGATGTLTAFLHGVDGQTFDARAQFVVKPAAESPAAGTGRSEIQTPRIEELFESDWPPLKWDETSVARVDMSTDETVIFVNADNRHLRRLLMTSGYQQTGLERMRTNFVLYTAFFAFLQHQQIRDQFSSVPADVLEHYMALEFDRLAQTVVTSIASVERIESLAIAE